MSWRVVTPVIALAALGMTACSNSEEPSDLPGTTPPVWTGAADPEAHGAEGGHAAEGQEAEGHGAEGQGADGHDSGAEGAGLSSTLKDASGAEVGTATFTESDGGVKVELTAEGLTPGFHGFHVHSVAKCEPNSVAPSGGEPGDFKSAGGHFQVEGHEGHPASGDLTSVMVTGDGSAHLTTTTDAFTLDDLRNGGEGTSVMIHEGADNFGNIPTRYVPAPDEETLSTGDAGGRVACGVIAGS
ncbi:MAG: superoxide dismutase family protein [Rhodococcus sp.]|nr:superoxide dismutase family protein [Rhodococcus sp. (in: high G+C Gram-positive bacteria)]